MRYGVQWGDPLGNRYVADISRKGDTSGELMRYAAGRNAFRLDEDDETEVLQALRVTTGQLDVVAKVADLVVPTRDDEWRFKLLCNGEIVFSGWLKCEALEMPLSGDYEEFTYTVIDVLECLKCRKMELTGLVTVGELIAWCLVALVGNGNTKVYWGNGIYWEKDGPGVLKLMVNASQWKTDDGYDDCQKVLEDIALSTGSTVRSCADGGISFQTLRDTHYTVYETAIDTMTGRPVLSLVGSKAVAADAVEWRGEHTLCVTPGRRHVTITTGGQEYKLDGASLSGGELLGGVYHMDESPRNDGSGSNYFPFYWKGMGVNDDDDGKPRLEFTGTGKEEEFLPGVGSYCVEEDYWNTGSSEDTGSGQEGDGKRNVELKRVLYVVQTSHNSIGLPLPREVAYREKDNKVSEQPALLVSMARECGEEIAEKYADHTVRLKGKTGSVVKAWLDVELKFKPMSGKKIRFGEKYVMSPLKLSERPLLAGRPVWLARLKAGEWYCNGGYDGWKVQPWQKEPCTMILDVKMEDYGKNKEWTLDPPIAMNTVAHVDGFGIPLPSAFSGGDIELTLFGLYYLYTKAESHPLVSGADVLAWKHTAALSGMYEAAITSLGMSLSLPLQASERKETYIRRQRIDDSANDTVSATVPFCTGGIAPNCGMLMRTAASVTRSTADVLLAQYVAAYSHPSFFVRLEVAFDPARRRGGLHKVAWRGRELPVVGSSVDTESGVETVTLWCGDALPVAGSPADTESGDGGSGGGTGGSGDGPGGE